MTKIIVCFNDKLINKENGKPFQIIKENGKPFQIIKENGKLSQLRIFAIAVGQWP